jgi:hypothetical protein
MYVLVDTIARELFHLDILDRKRQREPLPRTLDPALAVHLLKSF